METQLKLSESRHLDMLKRLSFAKRPSPTRKSNNVSQTLGAEDSLLMSEKKTFQRASVAKQQSQEHSSKTSMVVEAQSNNNSIINLRIAKQSGSHRKNRPSEAPPQEQCITEPPLEEDVNESPCSIKVSPSFRWSRLRGARRASS